jgi:tetratricopeptide (TPR) repeat protein
MSENGNKPGIGRNGWVVVGLALGATAIAPAGGCGPSYWMLRREGQRAVADGSYAAGKHLFLRAQQREPRAVENLHDLGVCSVMIAKEKFRQRNYAAAMRELDDAVAYYSSAIDADPGHQASLEGKNIALKLRGQFDEALHQREWAAEFVGPSATQFILLAKELEQRGDLEGALLRYRQAVAMEPNRFEARVALAAFLIETENTDAALSQLRIAHRLNPKDQWVADKLSLYESSPRFASGAAPGQ